MSPIKSNLLYTRHMNETIFSKIIRGEIPCHKVYEDDRTFVFLDIHPVQPGMLLVVTKTPAETFLDLDATDAAALWQTVRRMARRLKLAFPDKKRIGVQIEGLDVPHVHVKLFPIDSGKQFRAEPPSAEPDHPALAALAEKLTNIGDK
jgi:histidine triad (HIT) family protein